MSTIMTLLVLFLRLKNLEEVFQNIPLSSILEEEESSQIISNIDRLDTPPYPFVKC